MLKNIQKTLGRYLITLTKEPIKTSAIIIQKKRINHDCYIYKMKLDQQTFQLGIGQHFRITQFIKTHEIPQGEQVSRKYTPINQCSQKDVLDVLLKIYRRNSNIIFPNGGKLTPYLQSLKEGDHVNIEGPYGKFGYEAGGNIVLQGKKQIFKRIFFIAGGSGITPCYQVIRQIAKMSEQKIEMILLFGNKTEEDIVLRKELEQLQSRIKLHYILDRPPANWKGFKGYITQDVLKSICNLDDPDTLYVYCGPFAMNSMMRTLFGKQHPESKIFKF